MAQIYFKDTLVGDFEKPYIIAEVNSSHNGSLETAYEMVKVAKEIGCDCVKFQSWSAESLYSKSYYLANPIAKRIVKKFSFSEEDLINVANFCREQRIDFASTPYSEEEVDLLVEKCDVPFLKVASMDLTNHQFLTYIAQKNRPIILSTGMAEIEEIKEAVKVIEATGNKQLTLLHCIAIYPAETKLTRLHNILGLRKEFPNYPIGFSDHSEGPELAIASIALGAAIIEKHFTLDSSKIGMDNQMATEPTGMKQLVNGCHKVYEALGGMERIVGVEELEQRKKMRRSIVSARDLKTGIVLTLEDLTLKRPGDGIPAERINDIVGKVLKNDVLSDMLITIQDLV